MLTELSDIQESDEDIWGSPTISISMRTREYAGEHIIERTYTFGRSQLEDKWALQEFEERKSTANKISSKGDWETVNRAMWHEQHKMPDNIDIPPEVQQELMEILDLDEITLEHP